MATATSIEIKRAQEAERLANEIAALNAKLDEILTILNRPISVPTVTTYPLTEISAGTIATANSQPVARNRAGRSSQG